MRGDRLVVVALGLSTAGCFFVGGPGDPVDAGERDDARGGLDGSSGPADGGGGPEGDGGSPGSCEPGLTACGGACVELYRDPSNCGACGNACPGPCRRGECVESCVSCNGHCFDNYANDGFNCHGCDIVCPAGWTCQTGECTTAPCDEGETACSRSCVDLATDGDHCGACGRYCATTEQCTGGACECLPGRTRCATGCEATLTDPMNCGECGRVCTAPTANCRAGVCSAL